MPLPMHSLVLVCNSGMGELIGIFAGHCYFFLKTKYPRDYGGPNFLETPMLLRKCFPEEERQAVTYACMGDRLFFQWVAIKPRPDLQLHQLSAFLFGLSVHLS